MNPRRLKSLPDLPPEVFKIWTVRLRDRPTFDRARDALMYWEVANHPERLAVEVCGEGVDEAFIHDALTDDTTGPIEWISVSATGEC